MATAQEGGAEPGPQSFAVAGATLVGLLLSLVAPVLYTIVIGPWIFGDTPEIRVPVGLALMWALAFAIVAIVLLAEKQPLSSVGIRAPRFRLVLLAVAAGIVLSFLVPALAFIAGLVFPAKGSGTISATVSEYHWTTLLISVLTAAITEELLFRGYALERLNLLLRRPWLAAVVQLAFFTAVHAGSWGAAHLIGVVIPLGAAMTALYLWRRNLLLVIIAHFLIDVPLVIIATLA